MQHPLENVRQRTLTSSINSHMLHYAATAERYYIRPNAQKLGSEGHSKLRRLFRPQLETPQKN